jgi:Transposase DDE domain
MNDPVLTPVLEEMLAISAEPFRLREIGAIIDSSKVSQLRTAHARLVDYGTDKRPDAEWMKAHALIGVETMVVLAVEFSAKNVHDSRHLKSLVEKVPKAFALRFLLGDRAYLSEDILGWLWQRGLRAVIPVKSKWDPETKKQYYEAAKFLAEWYDGRPREFDEVYRLRPKIEGLFSLMKRLADGFCWSRGRPRTGTEQPTAWKNEVLCKFIYLNLRATVTLGEETGYRDIEYRNHDRFFPAPVKPLLIDPP